MLRARATSFIVLSMATQGRMPCTTDELAAKLPHAAIQIKPRRPVLDTKSRIALVTSGANLEEGPLSDWPTPRRGSGL